MELNLWTEDFFLPQDAGLDLLADQGDGQYDDPKEQGRLGGDWKSSQREDVIEQLSALSSPDQNSFGDADWMETDINSFFEVLASQPQELSFPSESELFNVTSSLSTDADASLAVFNDIIIDANIMCPPVHQDSLTPPDSPDQIRPVIKLENSEDNFSPSNLLDDSNFVLADNGVVYPDGLELDGIILPESFEPLTEAQGFQDSVDFLNSPLSVDDVESMLSISEPASPQSSNTSSFIRSNPELYKVIVAPSNFSNHSSLSIQKSSKSPKKPKAKKVKAEDLTLLAPENLANLNKKDRKRLQNKNAAIRYREKKKTEAKYIGSEVDDLETRNQELKTQVEDIEREIRYMKNLMQDIHKAKGRV